MSFSDFKTISQVQIDYQIHYKETDFIPATPSLVTTQFYNEIAFNINMLDVFSSEAARCELIILPILREAYKQFALTLSLWIQKPIHYNDKLTGIPDYIISKRSALGKTVLECPLLIIAEAKKNDFDQGWAQCLAELVAAQKLNNSQTQAVYGIVTDGKYWEFGRLIGTYFDKNTRSYVIDNLAELLGTLTFILTNPS